MKFNDWFCSKSWFVVVALVWLLSGCGTQHKAGQFQVVQGERFDHEKIGEIIDGNTSDNSLFDWFGQPLSRKPQNGSEKLLYRFTEVKRDETSGFLNSNSEELKVERTLEVVVKDGIVQSHEYSERRTKTNEENRF